MLNRWIPKELGWLQPTDQGMHLVLWLECGIDDIQLAKSARAAGVVVRAVSPMYSAGQRRSGLVLGIGGFSNAQMEAAVRSLAKIIMSMSQTKPLTNTTL